MDLAPFFSARSVAIIGVSRNPNKVGHVIFRNFIDSGYEGKLFAVNPHAEEVVGRATYASVLDIPERIELAIIAVPADAAVRAVAQCGKKGIRHVIVISSGFRETGNIILDKELEKTLKKYRMRCVGPNCLGCYDAHTKLDSLFLPRYRLSRPKEGGISFVCQSGAVGSSILDLATKEGYGFSKFCSYGNAMNVDESDLIEFLGRDSSTKVICLYVEGIRDGRKFLHVARAVSKKKPIIAIKGGVTAAGARAVSTHTGALAGEAAVYEGAFRQAGIIAVRSLEEMFNTARVLEKCIPPRGRRVQIITNGGGYGILATDALVNNNLELAKAASSRAMIKKLLPGIATENPLDLLGDATTERYKAALDIALSDRNSDLILLIVLYQTPLITTDIIDVISEAHDLKKKPMVVVSAGGEFTELLTKRLEEQGVPCFTFPENAVAAAAHLMEYYRSK